MHFNLLLCWMCLAKEIYNTIQSIQCFTRSRHIKDNLYVSNSGLLMPKYAPWTKDLNKAIAAIRAVITLLLAIVGSLDSMNIIIFSIVVKANWIYFDNKQCCHFLGGLIFHFFHEPLSLELTLDYSVFYFVDDSKEKLSLVKPHNLLNVTNFKWFIFSSFY